MVYKRATKKLREAGIEHIVVVKRLFGASLYDPRMTRQTTTCHKTWQDAVKAAINGERPTTE